MALYSVKFEIISPLTDIPNSQTVFGTICTFYAMHYGSEELEKILKQMENETFPFIVSSMFYEDMLPTPQNFEIRNIQVANKEDTKRLKKIKKIKYFSKKVFKMYKKNPLQFNSAIYDLIKKQDIIIVNGCLADKTEISKFDYAIIDEMRTRVKVKTDIDDSLYYNNVLNYFPKGTNLEFHIEIESNELATKLEELFRKMNYVSFGGNKSIGYNMFNFKSMEKEEDLKLNEPCMLLSLSIGDDTIDYDNSYYQLINVNNKFTNSKEAVNRKNVISFREGSIIKTSKKVIGKVIKESNNDETTYQNFVGLLI